MAQSEIPIMTYAEYKKLHAGGKTVAGVSNSEALRLVQYLPKRYQYAHLFWAWCGFVSIPGFISVSIFYAWWVGLLLLFIVSPMIFRGTRKSAAQFVLEHAEGDEQFFTLLVKKKVLIFKPT
jgi:hypothetical protein